MSGVSPPRAVVLDDHLTIADVERIHALLTEKGVPLDDCYVRFVNPYDHPGMARAFEEFVGAANCIPWVALYEPPSPAPTLGALPYWRRFERKPRAR